MCLFVERRDWDLSGRGPATSLALRGPIHEHRTDDGGQKTTVICHRKARARASSARTFLRQTPRPAVTASVPFVIPLGFEPKTHSLEGCCSIQLSYGTVLSLREFPGKGVQS